MDVMVSKQPRSGVEICRFGFEETDGHEDRGFANKHFQHTITHRALSNCVSAMVVGVEGKLISSMST